MIELGGGDSSSVINNGYLFPCRHGQGGDRARPSYGQSGRADSFGGSATGHDPPVGSLTVDQFVASDGQGGALVIVKRLWPFLLMATLTIWIGAFALTRVDLFWLSILLGMLLIIYSLVNLAGFRPTIPARHEIWTGAVAGVANGLLTGMTGSFVVPGVLYLQAISLPRDTLVQAMGILFTLSTIALSVALAHNGWLSGRLGLMSIAAVMPAMAGMLVGQRIRKSLSENLFRKIFYISLLMLGLYIVINTSVIGT